MFHSGKMKPNAFERENCVEDKKKVERRTE